jgi:hypothetical protein
MTNLIIALPMQQKEWASRNAIIPKRPLSADKVFGVWPEVPGLGRISLGALSSGLHISATN